MSFKSYYDAFFEAKAGRENMFPSNMSEMLGNMHGRDERLREEEKRSEALRDLRGQGSMTTTEGSLLFMILAAILGCISSVIFAVSHSWTLGSILGIALGGLLAGAVAGWLIYWLMISIVWLLGIAIIVALIGGVLLGLYSLGTALLSR